MEEHLSVRGRNPTALNSILRRLGSFLLAVRERVLEVFE